MSKNKIILLLTFIIFNNNLFASGTSEVDQRVCNEWKIIEKMGKSEYKKIKDPKLKEIQKENIQKVSEIIKKDCSK